MKKAISIPELLAGEKSTESKGIEFTHYLDDENGWEGDPRQPNQNKEHIVYLGKCSENGDMFFDRDYSGRICIFKGHLNNGTY